jgi:signal transduction histidine kinase
LRRRLLVGYLTVTLVTLFALVYPLGRTFAGRERDRLLRDIEHDAVVVGGFSEDALERGEQPRIDALLASYAADPGGRIVVVDTAGRSVADSAAPGTVGVDFANRPEIAAALQGNRSEGTRHSDTLGDDLVFVAVPVASGGIVHGAVRITYPSSALDDRVRAMWIGLTTLALVVLGVVSALAVALARLVTRPVDRLKTAARQLAAGDLGARAPVDVGAPELRELAEIFNSTAGRLEELLASQQAFVADASHQLRTPLAALRLQLENIESIAPAALQPSVAAARAETARLARITDALLALTRAGSAAVPCESVDVADVVRAHAHTWEPVATGMGVALTVDAPAHAWIESPPGAVEQILDNLLDNALDVSPVGSELRLHVALIADRVVLHVVDEGPGLTDEQRARAFDRFWRGPDAAEGGTGLGLAIVAELAARGGGHAALAPNEPRGIDATVSFPSSPRATTTPSGIAPTFTSR